MVGQRGYILVIFNIVVIIIVTVYQIVFETVLFSSENPRKKRVKILMQVWFSLDNEKINSSHEFTDLSLHYHITATHI